MIMVACYKNVHSKHNLGYKTSYTKPSNGLQGRANHGTKEALGRYTLSNPLLFFNNEIMQRFHKLRTVSAL